LPFSLSGARRLFERGGVNRKTVLVSAMVFLTLLVILFLGYFPLVFSPRVLFFPLLMLFPLSCVGFSKFYERASRPLIFLIYFSFFGFFAWSGSTPQREIRPDTLHAADVLGEFLGLHPEGRVLVEKKDLGWAVLWGLNDGDSRIVFDRKGMRSPKRFLNETWLQKKLKKESGFACVMSSSKKGRSVFENVRPALWRNYWNEGKYLMVCSTKP